MTAKEVAEIKELTKKELQALITYCKQNGYTVPDLALILTQSTEEYSSKQIHDAEQKGMRILLDLFLREFGTVGKVCSMLPPSGQDF